MTHTQVPGVVAQPAPFLAEHENQRAVDLIENAERSAPYCLCGAHMLAVADGGQVWLECSERHRERNALFAAFAKLTGWSHSRQLIMELPTE